MVYQTDRGGHAPVKPSADCSTTQPSPTGEDFQPWTVPPPMGEIRTPYRHFALIGLDAHGNVECHGSRPIERYLPLIFPSEIQYTFLQSTGMRTNGHSPVFSGNAFSGHKSRCRRLEDDVYSPFPPRKRSRGEPSPFTSREEEDNQNDFSYELPNLNRLGIEIGNEEKIIAYYRNAFVGLQQLVCREIAKAWIKIIEPRKQVNYPYNGGPARPGEDRDPEKTKPGWWAPGVPHKEPDHLRKADRVALLIHIIRMLLKQRGITADMLEEATREIHRIKLKKLPERQGLLDEIYRVRRAEESYERGEIDADTVIYVTNREPPKKSSEREESVSDAGRGESPVAESEDGPETRGAPAITTPGDTKYIRVSESLQPDEQHIGFPSSDLRAMFMDSKPAVQPDVDYLLSTPVEQPAMMGHWPSDFQHSPHSQPPPQPQALFVNIDYGTGSTDQILSPTVMRPHRHAMIPVSSESAVGGVPIAELTGARAQQTFDFISPTMAGHPTGPFRTGAISHPHYSLNGGGMPMHYKQL